MLVQTRWQSYLPWWLTYIWEGWLSSAAIVFQNSGNSNTVLIMHMTHEWYSTTRGGPQERKKPPSSSMGRADASALKIWFLLFIFVSVVKLMNRAFKITDIMRKYIAVIALTPLWDSVWVMVSSLTCMKYDSCSLLTLHVIKMSMY